MTSIDIFQDQIEMQKYNIKKNILSANEQTIQIAIFLHIFYPEYTQDLIDLIANIDHTRQRLDIVKKLNIFIATDSSEKEQSILQYFHQKIQDIKKTFNIFQIRIVSNQGRDIGPFVTNFTNEIKSAQILLKLHTKKHANDRRIGDEWRQLLYTSLAGSEENIAQILVNLIKNKTLGMVVPPHFTKYLRYIRPGNNVKALNSILRKLGISTNISKTSWIDFPSGSMFWAKSEALLPLLKLNLHIEDFTDSATASTDGNLEHAVERAFVFSTIAANLKWVRLSMQNATIQNQKFVLQKVYCHAQRDLVDLEQAKVLLQESTLFSEAYYRQTYGDLIPQGMSASDHFLTQGWKIGCNPSLEFDTIKYLLAYPDVASHIRNALIHYEKSGKQENRQVFSVDHSDAFDYEAFCKINNIDLKQACLELTLRQNCNAESIAIYAYTSDKFTLDKNTIYYLQELKKCVSTVIFIANICLPITEIDKIADLIDYCLCQKRSRNNSGLYKIGYEYLLHSKLLGEKTKYVIFCNDTYCGPFYDDTYHGSIYNLQVFIQQLLKNNYDFYGLTSSSQYTLHFATYFLLFKINVICSETFYNKMISLRLTDAPEDAFLEFDVAITEILKQTGFKCISYQDLVAEKNHLNYDQHPLKALQNHFPFVNKYFLQDLKHQNHDGLFATLKEIHKVNPLIYQYLIDDFHLDVALNDKRDIAFSVIIPTYNRKNIVQKAIDSVLKQDYEYYEIIVVDDCSSGGTKEYLQKIYRNEITKQKIKIYSLDQHRGVSATRNFALTKVKNEWVAYLDDDNEMKENFLRVFADTIHLDPQIKCLYCKLYNQTNKVFIGDVFDYKKLLQSNYIDLNTFVHHISLYQEYGGFNAKLTRLVDWDLILKYTKNYLPYYIDLDLIIYNNENNCQRITNTVNLAANFNYIKAKHTSQDHIATIILAYNQKEYIYQAIESALYQKGLFNHEILIADDGSTDGTEQIIEKYAQKYPMYIKNISTKHNKGIAQNYLHAFTMLDKSTYVAILEGDDYWSDFDKLQNQLDILKNNADCSMVFSKIHILNEAKLLKTTLPRQEKLSDKLTLSDCLASEDINLLGTFSTAMFRKELLQQLPEYLYNFRLSEVPVTFFMEQFGWIGFVDKIQTTYRMHSDGVWSGMNNYERAISSFCTTNECLLTCKKELLQQYMKIYEKRVNNSINMSNLTLPKLRSRFLQKLQKTYWQQMITLWYFLDHGEHIHIDNQEQLSKITKQLELNI